MIRFLYLLLPFFFFIACHAPEKPASGDATVADSSEKKNFFPVLNILKAEIADVDSTPALIRVYHINGGKKDSLQLQQGEFDAQAAVFLVPGLDSASLARRFSETSFMDQTTGMLTFTYACKDNQMGLRRVDVLAEPSPSNDKVRTIYLEVSAKESDSLKIKRMTWVSGSYFSVVEVIHPGTGSDITRETRVVWDNH